MRQSKSIGIIGAGAIGFNLAQSLARNGFDVLLHNRYHTESDGSPSKTWIEKEGKVDDLNDALEHPIQLTRNLSDLVGSYAIVITAGATRKDGESRADLARKNANIAKAYIPTITASPDTLVMVVSNPVDGLTRYLIEHTAAASNRKIADVAKKIIGVSYVDTTRLRNLIREAVHKSHPEIHAPDIKGLVLGEHGPTMVPLISHVTVNDRPLMEFVRPEQLDHIIRGVVTRGNDIIVRTGTSAVAGPSIAVINMIKAMAGETPVRFPCSAFDGDDCMGRLVEFKGNTIHQFIDDVPMSQEEKAKLHLSAKSLAQQYEEITGLIEDSNNGRPAPMAEQPTYEGSLDRINQALGKK